MFTDRSNINKSMGYCNAYKYLTALLALLVCGGVKAQIPAGYYDSLNGKSGEELKTAIHNLIQPTQVLNYGKGEGSTWSGFYKTDRLDDNQVVERYSTDVFYFTSATNAPTGMNIEHSFPKSWWGGSESVPAYKDLFNLMPSKTEANSKKANYPMGIVKGNASYDNGAVKIGTSQEGVKVWEPIAKWRGDFSRGMMYMATAYQDYTWKSGDGRDKDILVQGAYPTLKEWAYKLYIQWAMEDAVDELETKRNNAVADIQGNRNPYVDFPNLMHYVWGDSVGVAFNPMTTVKTFTLSTGIKDIEATPADKFDPSMPYEVYFIDGRKTSGNNNRGMMIIRQGKKTFKVIR